MAETGIKLCHYAVMPNDKVKEYGVVKPIPGAVSINMSPTVVARGRAALGGYGSRNYINYVSGSVGTLKVMNLPVYFLVDVLRYQYNNGRLTRYAIKKPVHFALLYQSAEIERNGLSPVRCSWYDCICSGFPENIETITESLTAEPIELAITAYPCIADGSVKTSISLADNPSEYAEFFEKVT